MPKWKMLKCINWEHNLDNKDEQRTKTNKQKNSRRDGPERRSYKPNLEYRGRQEWGKMDENAQTNAQNTTLVSAMRLDNFFVRRLKLANGWKWSDQMLLSMEFNKQRPPERKVLREEVNVKGMYKCSIFCSSHRCRVQRGRECEEKTTLYIQIPSTTC